MPLTAYAPKDAERYKRHPDSILFSPVLKSGDYVFVQDIEGKVWVLPNGCHVHPLVLGRARPAVAAGELTIGRRGLIELINNQ